MTALEIATKAKVGEGAKALLRDDLSPSGYVDLLVEKALYKDAVQFLAFAMPQETAVQWAAECAKQFRKPGETPAKGAESLAALETWMKSKSDADARAAKVAAEKGGMSSPADCAAMAAFFTGKSITPPEAPPTPPPEGGAQKLAAGSVQIAAVSYIPEKAPETFKQAIEKGRALAGFAAAAK